MKLEKREVTLNEADSLEDIYFAETALAKTYAEGLFSSRRKETKNALLRLMKETFEEVWTVGELHSRSIEEI